NELGASDRASMARSARIHFHILTSPDPTPESPMRRLLTLSLWLVGALAASAQEAKDPYQWLEDVTADKSLEWAKERNAKTTAEVAQGPEFKALDERLRKILDAKDRIPMIGKDG